MQLPIKISYRGLEKSDQTDNLVLEYSARLERFCDHINRCDVAIEQTNHTHNKGNPYRCRIDVTVAPRHELVADPRQHAFAEIILAPRVKHIVLEVPPAGAACGVEQVNHRAAARPILPSLTRATSQQKAC